MKKWIAIAVILMCCLVYAIVKLSMSENQNVNDTTEEKQITKQINADNTDKATPEEGSGSAVPAVQVEAVTKVLSEFLSAIKSEDYEQAWKLTSEFFKSKLSFEEFKKVEPETVNLTIHPESAINIEGRVGLLVTLPSEEQGMYFLFNQEDGQWKLDGMKQSAQNVDTPKE
ncbi:MAG TPA: hypothetical protein VMW72_01975 [Sedimentisphaerales bacterium]|nr:hypothetical protein [Sedimentisphaerales bacterium]